MHAAETFREDLVGDIPSKYSSIIFCPRLSLSLTHALPFQLSLFFLLSYKCFTKANSVQGTQPLRLIFMTSPQSKQRVLFAFFKLHFVSDHLTRIELVELAFVHLNLQRSDEQIKHGILEIEKQRRTSRLEVNIAIFLFYLFLGR